MLQRVIRPCRVHLANRLALSAVLCLLMAGPALAAETKATPTAAESDSRAIAPAPLRHLLVKAQGSGVTSEDAEKDLLQKAHEIAIKRLEALGGAAALDPAPEARRVVNLHRFPVLGFAQARAVGLVEFRLRGMDEPPPAAAELPSLSLDVDAGTLVMEAAVACDAIVVIETKDAEAEILPGGGGAAYHLTPATPLRQALPRVDAHLRVLACTGGLNPPVDAPTADGALAKAREGRPRLNQMQGVVSACVEYRAHGVAGVLRSYRQKGSESPVNMSGAAGRESGLPVPPGK
jgi:hypothetical protein